MPKALLLLLKAAKLGPAVKTLITMVLSVGTYAIFWGWRYAVGFVALIFCHEMGHFLAARQRGLPVGTPTFIPFVGAWIQLDRMAHDDEASKKLYRAKELRSEGSTDDTLDSSVRAHGRRGVLVLNAVATVPQLELIRGSMPAVIEATAFDEGERHADDQPGTDERAAYGLAALIAGGVAATSGLVTKLLALVLARKKLVILPAIALVAGVRGLMSRRKSNDPPPPIA